MLSFKIVEDREKLRCLMAFQVFMYSWRSTMAIWILVPAPQADINNSLRSLISFLLIVALQLVSTAFSAESGDPGFEDVHFSGSATCASCHNNLTDSTSKDVSIETAWSSTMMANATRDPYWIAKVASELKRAPHLSSVINDKCSRCHVPMAHESAIRDVAPIVILDSDNGFLNPANTYFDHAMDGVSCTLCHRIEDDENLGTLDGFSGAFSISDVVGEDRPSYAQYSGVNTTPMRNNVQFTPKFGAHTSSSETCATCHDLKTPFVDADGLVASTTQESEFPEQMPFTEWQHSDYRIGGSKQASCQSCHMPKITGTVPIASKPGSTGARSDFAEHTLVGGNTTMLEILDTNRTELGVSATGFTQKINETRALLQTAATVEILDAAVVNDNIEVSIRVTNHGGHKLPTSYPSRRAFIHFLVEDGAENNLFESGKMNSDGSIEGVATDTNSSIYEPHYNLITSEDQVQVYEPIMVNTDDEVTHTLLRAARYIKDNRITPSGFVKATAPNDIEVLGAAATDADFSNGSDTLTYRIALDALGTVINGLTISADLDYQSQAFGHLQDLFVDDDLTEVAAFKTMFESRAILKETLGGDEHFLCAGDSLLITEKTFSAGSSTVCEASETVSTLGSVIVQDGGDLRFVGESIQLAGGFRVNSGGKFSIN
jgi:hypothetical protein